MILPPGTEKSTLAALESLLSTPTPARLPPPPYSHLLADLERTRTGESSRSGRSGRSARTPAHLADRAGAADDGGREEEGRPGGAVDSTDTRRCRRRSDEHRTGLNGLRGMAIAGGGSSNTSQIELQPVLPTRLTTSIPFLPGPTSPESSPSIRTTHGSVSGSVSDDRGVLVEKDLGKVAPRKSLGRGGAWTGARRMLGMQENRAGGSSKPLWKKRNRRRWALFALVLFLFVGGILGGTLGGLYAGQHLRGHRGPHQKNYAYGDGGRIVVPWRPDTDPQCVWNPYKTGPPAYDGNSTSCNAFAPLSASDPIRSISFSPTGMNQSVTTFFLPMNASELFIHSLGDSASGSIRIPGTELTALLSEEMTLTPPDQARVDVVMNWRGNTSTAGMVCGMTKPDGGVGVGVYTGKTSIQPNMIVAPNPDLSFFILVRFPPPTTRDAPILPLLNITTDQMSVRLGNLTNVVLFERLEVHSSQGAITSGYVAGQNISLLTGTATIAGTYNTSSSLVMNTTAGGILANVIAWNPDLSGGHDTDTSAESANTYLRRSPGMRARGSDVVEERGPGIAPGDLLAEEIPVHAVSVTAETTSGPLILTYLAQDPGIILSSTATTTNADIHVSHHSSFQGSFLVKSAIGDMKIPEANDFVANGTSVGGLELDPLAANRVRAVSYHSEEDDDWAIKMSNSTGSNLGYKPQRGNAVYDSVSSTWSVQGITIWLTPEELLAGANNIAAEILVLAKQLTNTSALTGQAAMRQSTSVCTTTWGGAKLEW